jgi:hypothetical protein
VANPMVGSRVQQTCKALRGANRRSREERQGRNELGTWRPRAKGTSDPFAGLRFREWTRSVDVDGGAIFGQPQERSPDGRDASVWHTERLCLAGVSWSYGQLGLVVSEGEDKARGSCQGTCFRSRGTPDCDGTLKDPR